MKKVFLVLSIFVVVFSGCVDLFLMPGMKEEIQNEVKKNQLYPYVIIESPINDELVGRNFTVMGKARSANGVKEVYISIDNADFVKAEGTEEWSKSFSVNETKKVEAKVFCVDVNDNVSETNLVSFFVNKNFVGILYVSTNGNDNNDGMSPQTPFRSIPKAIEFFYHNYVSQRVIYISVGTYTPGNGLLTNSMNGILITNNNIRLIGGWDTGFNNIVGYSELDGNNSLKHVIFAMNVSNLVMSNLVVKKGNANDFPHNSGGGIYLGNVSYSLISNVVISNNSAYYGGGLYLTNSTSNTISGVVSSNSAYYGGGLYLDYSGNNTISSNVYGNVATNGGGLYLDYSTNNTISGDVSGNSANWYGGGLYLDYSASNTINGVVSGNSASYDGGGLYLWYSASNTINGVVSNNIATNNGGGLYLDYSGNNTISSNVYGNVATNGGGLYLDYSTSNTISGVVSSNSAYYGGGLYLDYSGNNTISSNVYGNVATNGGGLYLDYSTNNTISGDVSGNSANWYGGGLYLDYSASNTINGVVSNNIATNNGGGLYLESSGNNTISGVVSGNIAANNGGGLYLWSSASNTISGVVSGNSANNGGGLYLWSSASNTISGVVSGNSATSNGGGLYIYDSANTSILNSYITNNWAISTNSVIHLYNTGLLTGLVISNCWIGGNNDTNAIGIFEDGSDITGQVLKNNKFITNKLRYLYRDYVNGYIATNDSSWINVNNPSNTGATMDSTNNIATNM